MEDESHVLGHRERLRERFSQTGVEGFHGYEILELLLTYSIPRRDVKPFAKHLIKRFGSLGGVMDASLQELEEMPGIARNSAILIRLAKEICQFCLAEKLRHGDLLGSPEMVVDFARMRLAGLSHETFMVIFLNAKNESLGSEIIVEGTIDGAVVYPRRILEEALACHAAALILVHNHPSGHSTPSRQDKHLTQTLIGALEPLDIRVLDHIIVSKSEHYSFAQHKLL